MLESWPYRVTKMTLKTMITSPGWLRFISALYIFVHNVEIYHRVMNVYKLVKFNGIKDIRDLIMVIINMRIQFPYLCLNPSEICLKVGRIG
jgi:hypothetical protein